ncbi:MAG: ABC transporter ATP-binding protein [Lentisphaerae bacterium]|nr:ABC transporter ATP-binding protein [Lentisphaerota bacterium]
MTPPSATGAPGPAALLAFEQVSKVYAMGDNRVHALRDVSFTVAPGEFCAVMGASGSGKSTLLNIMGCLDRPDAGRYTLDGRDVGALDDTRLSRLRLRRLGFIFQSFNLIPQLSVERNIELPLFYLGWDSAHSRARARELAARVGLDARLTHRPSELSGGQQQRVAIARALANDPAIILADEPTGNLDSATGEQILGLLQTLNGDGRTIIMVTHETDVGRYANHHIHMRDGRIARETP